MPTPQNLSLLVYLGDLDRGKTDSQGIISYAVSLTRAVASRLSGGDRMIVVCSGALVDEIRELGRSDQVDLVVWAATRSRLRRLLRDSVGVARVARRSDVGIVHLPKGLLLTRRVFGARYLVSTVHDDIPFRYAQGEFSGSAPHMKLKIVCWAIRRSLRDSDIVLTISEFSRRALEKLTPEGAGAEIVNAGCATTLGEHRGPRDREDTFVVFDSPFGHKHAAEGLDFALRYISAREGSLTTVTLIGDGIAARLPQARDGRVRRIVRLLAPDELREVLIRARAVVVSSRYEGFGLPAIEGWSLGTPVVAAACDAAKEALSGLPGLYESGNFEAFAEVLTGVLALSQAEVDRYARIISSRHSWAKTGEATIAAYRGLRAQT